MKAIRRVRLHVGIGLLLTCAVLGAEEIEDCWEGEEFLEFADFEEEEDDETEDLELFAFADEEEGDNAEEPNEVFLPQAHQLVLSHIEKGGVGYKDGYTTLGAFLTLKRLEHCYFFSEVNYHLFDNRKSAGNLGAGVRINPHTRSFVMGLNAYYDVREDHTAFNRLSVGIDLQRKNLFLSTNGYCVVDPKVVDFRKFTNRYDDGYYIQLLEQLQAFRYSWDAEMGILAWTHAPFRLYVGVGTYYLKDSSFCPHVQNVWGEKGRVTFEILPSIKIDFIVTNDSRFHTKYQGQIAFVIPLHAFSKWKKRNRYFFPVTRQEIIPLTKSTCWKWNY